jgi:small subunit ribosomal protein S11
MGEEKDIKDQKDSEDKKEVKKNVKKAPVKSAVVKDEKKEEKPAEKKKAEDDQDILKVKKNALGLEELPEEIQKKLEKKKAEREQNPLKSKSKKKKKRTERKNVPVGKAFVKATYNNTIVTLTDLSGNVLSWASAGIAGFKGPKKSTPYAAQIISRIAVAKAREEYGLTEVIVFVKGVGTGRESAIRALNSNGLIINAIKDITPIPHNGCRARKPRRV